MSENKPREFWIENGSFVYSCVDNKEQLKGWKSGNKGPWHVIEYSAYLDLQKKYDDLEAEYKKSINTYISDNRAVWTEKAKLEQQIVTLDEGVSHWSHRASMHRAEADTLKQQNAKLVEVLKDLIGHVDASLLFPHKDRIDVFKSEQQARQVLAELGIK